LIQILLGVLFLVAALAILMGAGDTLRLPVGDIFPLIGYGGVGLITGLGALFIARGVYGRNLKAASGIARASLRSKAAAATTLLAVLILALVLPFTAGALNLMSLAGFPVGYYMAAQGAPLLILIFVFLWILREDAIAAESQIESEIENDSQEGSGGRP
jgi:putative solute:sodium symporter small subunit